MRGFLEKALLRDAMRGVLPERIRKRRKQPFVTPIREWFFAPGAPDYVREVMSRSALERAGLFDAPTVERLLQRLDTGPRGTIESGRIELVLMLVLGVHATPDVR